MLKCTDEDDPGNYDKEDCKVPLCQRAPGCFNEVQQVVAAAESFKIQARGLQIRNELGPMATDAAVAAVVRGDVEATLQSTSNPAPPPRGEAEAKPATKQLKCYPYTQGGGGVSQQQVPLAHQTYGVQNIGGRICNIPSRGQALLRND